MPHMVTLRVGRFAPRNGPDICDIFVEVALIKMRGRATAENLPVDKIANTCILTCVDDQGTVGVPGQDGNCRINPKIGLEVFPVLYQKVCMISGVCSGLIG